MTGSGDGTPSVRLMTRPSIGPPRSMRLSSALELAKMGEKGLAKPGAADVSHSGPSSGMQRHSGSRKSE